ncbi:MAG: UvrB/UvrC motif-containing protein [Phycisphaerales bacterium JB038]
MKCDRCDNEATVHEVNIVSGQKHEVHLCQECAAELGLVQKPTTNIAEILAKMVMNPAPTAKESKTAAPSCESCGTTFAEVRKKGVLGCAHCYDVFDEALSNLLLRAHEGGTHHVGKVPKRAGGKIDHEYQILRCRRQLQEAVDREDYERAASLRDSLRQMEEARGIIPETRADRPSESGLLEDGGQ